MNTFYGMPDLTYFSANDSPFENGGVVHLAECANLGVLQLDGTKLTEAGSPNFSSFRKLESLSIANTHIGKGLIIRLREMTALQHINLSGTLIADSELHYLALLPGIRSMNRDGTKITNACVPSLLACKYLEQVSVIETGITASAIPGKLPRGLPRIITARDDGTQDQDSIPSAPQASETI